MNYTLFNAILAMDSYNRGYAAGIELPGSDNEEVKIGAATIKDNSSDLLGGGADSAIGFYALAYNYNGSKIISYRGTDYPDNDTLIPKDITHGWTLDAGLLASE